MGSDIHAADPAAPKQDRSDVDESLSEPRNCVDGQAREAIGWLAPTAAGKKARVSKAVLLKGRAATDAKASLT